MRKSNSLSTILIRSNLSNNLSCYITCCRERMRFLNHGLSNNCTILKHILKIYKAAIKVFHNRIIHIMNMNNTLFMCLNQFIRKYILLAKFFRNFASHIISLSSINSRILICILLSQFFILIINKTHNSLIKCFISSINSSLISITNVITC